MNDTAEDVYPEYIYDQNRNHERVLDLLNMIHNTSSSTKSSNNFELPVLFNTGTIDFNKDNNLIFGGRYVIMVDRLFPLKLSRRLVKPQFTRDGSFRPDPECILKKLFKVDDLKNILLLITPTVIGRKFVDEHVLHGYSINDEIHLGVTILTAKERDLIVQQHSPKNYSLILSTGYIDLEEAFMKTRIRNHIFLVLQQKPANPICAWNGDCRILLKYHNCDPKPKTQPRIIISAQSEIMVNKPTSLSTVSDKRNMITSPKPDIMEIKPCNSSTVSEKSSRSVESIPRQTGGQEKAFPAKLRPVPKVKLIKKSPIKGIRKKKKSTSDDTSDIRPQNIDRSSKDSEIMIPKKRKVRRKKKNNNIMPNANLTPEERKALVEKLYKERLLKRERKWKLY